RLVTLHTSRLSRRPPISRSKTSDVKTKPPTAQRLRAWPASRKRFRFHASIYFGDEPLAGYIGLPPYVPPRKANAGVPGRIGRNCVAPTTLYERERPSLLLAEAKPCD